MVSALIESHQHLTKSIKQNDGRLAYSAKEVCQSLGISAKTLSRLEQRGLIRHSAAVRKKLYPRREIERFLAETLS